MGGGAAGLSTAWYLRERGYRHVVVLERAERVGGKCDSFTHDGRSFDLGAFTATLDYRYVLEIARAVGAPLCAQPRRLAIRWDTDPPEVTTILRAVLERHSPWQLVRTAVRYLGALWRYRSIVSPPGFAGVTRFPELTLPFGQWAEANGMAPLVDVFRLPVTDMGYGDVATIPAAYVLKYMDLLNVTTIAMYVLGIGLGWPKRFREGYGRLWERVAWRLDVRTRVEITRISRDDEITVEWQTRRAAHGGGDDDLHRATFDRLVLACPLEATAPFLDWSDVERALFDRIEYRRYFVTVCRVRGTPVETLDAMRDLEPGHAWEIMRPWGQADVAVFYTSGAPGLTLREVLRNIERDVPRAFPGAEVVGLLRQVEWRYFPHVPAEAMRTGYYDALEGLQGHRSTYLAGGLLAFETVENVVQYSHDLVRRHFHPM